MPERPSPADPDSSGRKPRLPDEVRAWGAVSLLSDLGHEAVTAILPLFLMTLGAGPAALGAIEGASDALSAFAKLWGGRLADRAARLKRLAVVGYILTSLAIPAIALARSWAGVLILRAIGWTGRGFRSPLRDTLIVRVAPRGILGWAFGLERAMDQIGAVLAPLAVLLLLQLSFDLPAIIGLTLVPGILCVTCVLFFVRDHPRPPEAASGREERGLPLPLRRYLGAVALFGSGDFAKTLLVLWALGPRAGSLSPGEMSGGVLLYMFFNAVTVGSAYGAGRICDVVGRKPVLVAAYALGGVGAAVPVFLDPGWAAGALALGLSGLLVGAEESVERAWAADLAGGRHGRAFGLLHAINGMGDLLASVLVGALWAWSGPAVAFGVAAVLMAAGTLLTLGVPQPAGSRSRA